MSYQSRLDAERRLLILRALEQAAGLALRETVLLRLLEDERVALGRDDLRAEFRWLADQGLAQIEYLGAAQALRLSARGLDAAAGRITVPGVARPEPGA